MRPSRGRRNFPGDEPGLSVNGETMTDADDFPTPADETTPPLDAMSLRLAAANALIRRRRTIKPADMSEKPIANLHLAT
ncbi:MAG: hypothetical protein KDN19_05400, partial [Verrucomicrobiae bacterium]|nr:hypothetical protein [Verrucomicrobiae bacterium]